MKLILVLALLAFPAMAQDGPAPTSDPDVFMITKEEIAKINALLDDAAKIIRGQRKEIERLKAGTGCS